MPDPIMYASEDHYVVLEANQPEQFLTAEELLEKLRSILTTRQDDLPPDLRSIPQVEAQAKYLMATSCELAMDPGQFLQWYVVRLEK